MLLPLISLPELVVSPVRRPVAQGRCSPQSQDMALPGPACPRPLCWEVQGGQPPPGCPACSPFRWGTLIRLGEPRRPRARPARRPCPPAAPSSAMSAPGRPVTSGRARPLPAQNATGRCSWSPANQQLPLCPPVGPRPSREALREVRAGMAPSQSRTSALPGGVVRTTGLRPL